MPFCSSSRDKAGPEVVATVAAEEPAPPSPSMTEAVLERHGEAVQATGAKKAALKDLLANNGYGPDIYEKLHEHGIDSVEDAADAHLCDDEVLQELGLIRGDDKDKFSKLMASGVNV